jgi:hypothetical protein
MSANDAKQFENDPKLIAMSGEYLSSVSRMANACTARPSINGRRYQITEFDIDEHEDGVQRLAAASRDMFALLKNCHPPVWLEFWLGCELWTATEALPLLCGFCRKLRHVDGGSHPGPFMRLDGLEPYDPLAMMMLPKGAVAAVKEKFERELAQLTQWWTSSSNGEGRFPLSKFVTWAQDKGFIVEWLDWAEREGYMTAVAEPKQVDDELAGKTKTALLNIIGALSTELWKAKFHGEEKIVAERIYEALEVYKGYPGLSERNLKTWIPTGIKQVQSR